MEHNLLLCWDKNHHQFHFTLFLPSKCFKFIQGNDFWAYVLVDTPTLVSQPQLCPDTPEDIKNMLLEYADMFQDP